MINILIIFGLILVSLLQILPIVGVFLFSTFYILPIVSLVLVFTPGLFSHHVVMRKLEGNISTYYLGFIFRLILRLHFIPAIFGALYLFNSLQFSSGFDSLLIIINICLLSSLSLLHLHEFSHSLIDIDAYYCKIYSIVIGYGHFKREHLAHHEHPECELSNFVAKPYESIYSFVANSFVNGFISAFKSENSVLLKKEQTLIHNSIVSNYFYTLLLVVMLGLFFGWIGIVAYLAQLLFVLLLMQGLNYVQHYGLTRAEYGHAGVIAWEHTGVINGFLLLNSGLHNRHHRSPLLPSFLLNPKEATPARYRFGFEFMLLLALVPPLWFGIMEKKLDDLKLSVARMVDVVEVKS